MRRDDFARPFEDKSLGRVESGVIGQRAATFASSIAAIFFASARSLCALSRNLRVSGFTGRGLRAAVRASVPSGRHRRRPGTGAR
jgi:hypothetical protein